MLSKEETEKVIEILEKWPGGMGCVLLPDATKKRGYITAEWGFKGKKFGNFHYEDLKDMPEDALYCPVTAIGLMRSAKNYRDHNAAYKDIIATLQAAIKYAEGKGFMFGMTYEEYEIKEFYNAALKNTPKLLIGWFLYYKKMLEEQKK